MKRSAKKSLQSFAQRSRARNTGGIRQNNHQKYTTDLKTGLLRGMAGFRTGRFIS